jgi:SAM-dependent methyltransferase
VTRSPEGDRDADARRLSAASYAERDPTGWFDQLYAEAEHGTAVVPWDRGEPNPLLVEWAAGRDGSGSKAVVVGCGLGRDCEYLARLGYATTGFDLSATAIRLAAQRHPGSPVRYEVADLLEPPENYLAGFDLVVESYTVQSVPDPVRGELIAAVPRLVAPGGTLLVIAARGSEHAVAGPPFPLDEDEIGRFAASGLQTVRIEPLVDAEGTPRWRAEFVRP